MHRRNAKKIESNLALISNFLLSFTCSANCTDEFRITFFLLARRNRLLRGGFLLNLFILLFFKCNCYKVSLLMFQAACKTIFIDFRTFRFFFSFVENWFSVIFPQFQLPNFLSLSLLLARFYFCQHNWFLCSLFLMHPLSGRQRRFSSWLIDYQNIRKIFKSTFISSSAWNVNFSQSPNSSVSVIESLLNSRAQLIQLISHPKINNSFCCYLHTRQHWAFFGTGRTFAL